MLDHFSGPRALAGPAGDICDLYAFPSPERPGHLALVMTVLPQAGQDAFFSEAIICRFRLRPLKVDTASRSFPFGPEESECAYDVAFEAPRTEAGGGLVQDGRCTSSSGAVARFRLHNERGGAAEGLRGYAGLRSDPFFIDLPAWIESVKTGRLAFKPVGETTGAGLNALGVVVEVDSAALMQRMGTPLLGVVGETVVAGKLPMRIERIGRPEIKKPHARPEAVRPGQP